MFFIIGFCIESFVFGCILTYWFNNLNKKKKEYKYRRLMAAETKLIEIAKWIEGERIHHDPGSTEEEKNAFIIQWIKDHAAEVRETWEKSKCRFCKRDCFHNMKKECVEFVKTKL
jgi:hypothetical protein